MFQDIYGLKVKVVNNESDYFDKEFLIVGSFHQLEGETFLTVCHNYLGDRFDIPLKDVKFLKDDVNQKISEIQEEIKKLQEKQYYILNFVKNHKSK